MPLKSPSPALVVSCVALAVALGGTGYALTALPKNSVGNTQIKSNAVTSSKVKNGTLVAADFKAGVLSTLSGAQGAKGDTGAAGETGAAGPTGATGPTGPTASAYGVSNPVLSLSAGGAYAEVIRLTTASSASGPLVLPTAMRVFVMADLNAYKGSPDAATVGNLACRVRWAAVGGSFATLAPLPSASFPNVTAGTTLWQNLSVNAQVDLPAGRYDFAVQCAASNSSSFGTAPLTVYDVAMNVVAAAT